MGGSHLSKSSEDEKAGGDGSVAIKEGGSPIESPEMQLHIDPAEERKLIAKVDLFITPVIMLVYLCCFLDRSNIGRFTFLFFQSSGVKMYMMY